MPRRRTAAKPKTSSNGILLRYRDRDTAYGVTRQTATRIAHNLGLSETQVVHVALANLARQTLPRYEADNGPLTDEQYSAIEKLVPQKGFVSSKKNRLF
jgi:antitoxin component of RelBE/YafQ-DinJ toxin-antitoxin module